MSSRRFPYLIVLIPIAFAAMLLLARPHSHSSAKLTPKAAVAASSPAQPTEAPPGTETDQKTQKPSKGATPAKEAPKAAAVPFAAGEIMDYNVSWAAFPSAATLHLSVIERRN